jgi:hypothetical protein
MATDSGMKWSENIHVLCPTDAMKFTAILLGLFVAVAVAAPAANPEAKPEPAELGKRQCGQCYGGTRNCCGVGGCMLFPC